MPIRPARFSDIPIMARVLAFIFGPDELFQVLHPHQNQYPEDFITAFRRSLRVSWWDYSRILMVSFEQKPDLHDDDQDTGSQDLIVHRGGQAEIITGVCEWKRVGTGWQSVWNLWGWWDPRQLIKKFYEWRNKLSYFFRPCRAAAQPTATDPDPLLLENFLARTMPWCRHLYSNPQTPWRANHWILAVLGIHPQYQSKGHGKELVQYGLAKAKCDTASGRTGIPCMVTASLPGEPFYLRTGFKELVGYQSRSLDWVEGVNPLEEKGCLGGAVLWTWVKEDEDTHREKIAADLKSDSAENA